MWRRQNFVKMFDAGKTRAMGYRMVKKLWRYIISRFHLIPERNGQTDLLYQYRASVCWRAIKIHGYPQISIRGPISAHLWSLPSDYITDTNVFKKRLKTFWFDRAYWLIMPPPRRGAGALGGHRRPSSVRLFDVAYIGSNSKTKRPRKTKLFTGVPQVTCDSHTDFKVKSQGHGVN